MKVLLDFFGGAAKIFTWFITAVVLPVVAWFLMMRDDVRSLQRDALQSKDQVRKVESRVMDLEHESNLKHTEVIRSLGRIEGELRRIR